MIAVDTNVLLRALADDEAAPEQCSAARKLLAHAHQVRIASIVFMETLWVLQRQYQAPRKEVARIAQALLDHPRYQVQDETQLAEALRLFANSNIDFADAVALADARRTNTTLHTFDRKLAKIEQATLVATA